MKIILVLLAFSSVPGVRPDWDTDWGNWGPWSSCTAACGNSGTAIATRKRCHRITHHGCEDGYKSTSCNRFCSSGGTPDGNHCDCPGGYIGTCCNTHLRCSDPLTSLPNGEVSGDDYYWGGVVTYSCVQNYVLIGNSSRNCTENPAIWTGTSPTCTFQCPCQHGGVCSVPNNTYICQCTAGWFGSTCQKLVSCGSAPTIPHGTASGTTDFGDSIQYTCDKHYAPVGDVTRQCVLDPGDPSVGVWTGASPICLYDEYCLSDPCQNGATCVNEPGYYTCTCAYGWSGIHCEIDFLLPVVDSCPSDIVQYTSQATANVSWSPATFSDVHGFPIDVTTNFPISTASLPWGVTTLEYTGEKTNNLMTASCVFTISIWPNPCQPFPVPAGGALACNGWNSDFGAICGVFCENPRGPEATIDITQMLVCGASGAWYPPYKAFACNGNRNYQNTDSTYAAHFFNGQCGSEEVLETISANYVNVLKASGFNYACSGWADGCGPQNVTVRCG